MVDVDPANPRACRVYGADGSYSVDLTRLNNKELQEYVDAWTSLHSSETNPYRHFFIGAAISKGRREQRRRGRLANEAE